MTVTETLTLIFIILKLAGAIDWSWWVVLLPEIIAVFWYGVFVLLILIGKRREAKQLAAKRAARRARMSRRG